MVNKSILSKIESNYFQSLLHKDTPSIVGLEKSVGD